MKNWRQIRTTNQDLLSHLCLLRGLREDELQVDFVRQLHDPFLLPMMDKAVEITRQAEREKWHTVVFGDYDADGTIATAILSQTLKRLGLKHQCFLPKRTQGYGLNREVIEQLPSDTRLLITVDNGISAHKEIAHAKNKGIAVIVLDHHLPGKQLPEANAIVDPFLPESNYPFLHLCGAALAYKYTEALSSAFPVLTEAYRKWLLDLVAIATVADVMPILGENRAFVHFGLIVLRHNRREGLRQLLEVASIKPDQLSGHSLGYIIGPRFNASGRLSDNQPALDLLLETDREKLRLLARQIEKSNAERLALLERAVEEARAQIVPQLDESQHLLGAYSKDWPPGIVGLIAGRLAGAYGRPVVIGHLSGEKITASARSVPSFHLVDNLAKQKRYLLSYGGHRQAAGLSLAVNNWSKFIDGLQSCAKELIKPQDLQGIVLIEAKLSAEAVTWETGEIIARLAPFGHGNPSPIFLLEDWEAGRIRSIGSRGQHLAFILKKGRTLVSAVAFNWGGKEEELKNARLFVGQLENDEWHGAKRVQFRLLDVASKDKEIEVIDYDERKGNIFLS